MVDTFSLDSSLAAVRSWAPCNNNTKRNYFKPLSASSAENYYIISILNVKSVLTIERPLWPTLVQM